MGPLERLSGPGRQVGAQGHDDLRGKQRDERPEWVQPEGMPLVPGARSKGAWGRIGSIGAEQGLVCQTPRMSRNESYRGIYRSMATMRHTRPPRVLNDMLSMRKVA